MSSRGPGVKSKENIKSGKEIECSQYKLNAILFASLPFATFMLARGLQFYGALKWCNEFKCGVVVPTREVAYHTSSSLLFCKDVHHMACKNAI